MARCEASDGPDPQRPATAASLPDDLEDLAYDVLLAEDPGAREAGFARLLAEHGEHAEALVRLHRSVVGAETALADTGLAEAPPPRQLGAYRLVRKLGEGGFGVVWLAEQSAPIQRQVALKLIRPGMDTKNVLRRFEAEREVLARFDHPCIAKVLDAGQSADGQPFLVTEFVAGEPLVAFAQRRALALRARIELLRKVAEGVQHAHQRGVIHRDLKPSNVLVVEIDGVAWPKIIDFGIARAVEGSEPGHERTRAGSLLGTPEYMSPEQALGSADVDVRTDVHALGVMLFELLVGDLPLGRERWRRASLTEIVEWIRSAEAPRPSSRVPDATQARALRGDLDTIVLTALAKERERRYPSVQQFAADLEAFLAHRPIAAGAPGPGYLLRKFVRRHRTQVGAAAVVLLALVAGLATSVAALQRARSAEQRTARLAGDLRGVVTEYEALADVVRARELREQFAKLWPARPERAPGFRAWLAAADQLLAAVPAREQLLGRVRERALRDGDGAATFLADSLAGLQQDLSTLRQHAGSYEQAVWGRSWAEQVERRTLVEPAAAWRSTIDAIAASPRYRGLRIRPQLGLVPLGFDPDSGLCEFLHAQSGAAPRRDDGGRLVPDEAMGIVLVLLPGGRVDVGVQGSDPDAPHYDPRAAGRDGSVQSVELRPFFLSKYEATRAQWQRALLPGGAYFELGTQTGQGPLSLLQPAENLCWLDASTFAERLDLALPTDAQWEYACRAGTGTRWSTGDEPGTLQGHANIAGREVAGMEARPRFTEQHQDGYALPSPVGSFRANAFGLHDMHGNVAEVCADTVFHQRTPMRAGDGRREGFDPRGISVRGGSFADDADRARSGAWSTNAQENRTVQVGVRLMRPVSD